MTAVTSPRWTEFVAAIFYGLTASASCLTLCIAAIMIMPIAAPALWFGVPLSLIAGMMVIHLRLPSHSYPIGVLFVPIVGALLVLVTMQVAWTVLGDYL